MLMKTNQVYAVLFVLCLSVVISNAFPKNFAWNGGPSRLKCEHGSTFWMNNEPHLKDNVIAIKALMYMDDIYLLTPRMKHGVLSTVWLILREQRVELEPYPDLRSHNIGDCSAIQNAVDFYLDNLGNLWVLDTGIIDTLESPRCTCPPKVTVISILLGKITKRIDISVLAEPNSLLQNIVVEYGHVGKIFIYISDASRGAVLVYEVSSETGWAVIACAPSVGLQIAMIKRAPAHNILIIVILHQQGLFELDTSALRRRNSISPIRVYGDHTKAVLLLGSDAHHIYLRHVECSDVLSWDTRHAYNSSRLANIHSAGPRLTPTSVAAHPLRPILLVLDSNYADTVNGHLPTYHKISFIEQ
ncbi:uncharacterized protein LOC115441511 [Manduca sexta]|uniref:uncharacterized protein LOC115441511 n=1 Tax=Manduca sexta TaxID=7130 RepID=UPI0018901CC2|nr:uncharacterized protein LOC115441511 [Manduca sexta]